MTSLHFNYKDIFRAGRLGFSAKKIWMTFAGFLVAYIGYGILAYLAFIIAGLEIGEIWDAFRLVPIYPIDLPWFSWVVWLIGAFWWICVALLTGVAVSKITYEQLKGDDFFEIKEAFKFALKSGKSAIFAPVVLILFMIMLIIMGVILALITWIPFFGQLFFAVMAIPAFAVCMFILYLVIVTIVCLIIGPAIVGETGNDTFDTLFESFSVINDQPWRFIIYELLLLAIVTLGVGILGFFAAKAIFLGQDIVGIFHVDKLDNILMNAAYYVKITICPCCPQSIYNFVVDYLDSIGMIHLLYPHPYVSAYESWAGAISSFILGIIYYFIVLFVLSYGGAIFWSGNTLIFTVLVKKKDDKNLLEIKEEPFEESAVEEKKEEKGKQSDTEKKTKRTRKKKEEKAEEE